MIDRDCPCNGGECPDCLTRRAEQAEAKLSKVYDEGAHAIAVVAAENARLRAALIETVKLTGTLPFILAMEVGDLLGLRPTEARPVKP